MTIRVPTFVLGAIVFVVVTTAISFGVAFAVNQWRGSDYIDCITKVETATIDAGERHRADRPVVPKSPAVGASAVAFAAYQQQFQQYQDQFDNWVKSGDDIDRQWRDQMRACAS